MKNFQISLKKFLANKNTVTILGVLAAIVVLYIGYNMRIKQLTNPVSVPYALQNIAPRTKITSEMIGTIQVPPSMIKGNPYMDSRYLIGKYVNVESTIPKGSLFYASSVVDQSQLPDSIIYDYQEGYVLVNMDVNTSTTYGNRVYPGNYVDMYLKVINNIDEDETSEITDKIMIGKLIENIKVLAVLDSSGNDVFNDLDNVGTPSQIIFAVPEEYHILLRKAMYLRSYSATLIPVPTNESLKDEPGAVAISNEALKDFINKVTVWTGEGIDDNLSSVE